MVEKIGREAFLYLDPTPDETDFAQCSTCRDWVADDDRCVIHGPHVKVLGSMSCGFYVPGSPHDDVQTYSMVTPTESGLVDRKVRCENCTYGGEESLTCNLFVMLNKQLPEVFNLETTIHPKGCCNAQTPTDGGTGSDL